MPTLRPILLAALALCLAALAALADAPLRLAFSEATTDRIVHRLESGFETCRRLDAVYRTDCYRKTYRDAAAEMNGKPDYYDAQVALRSVEATLGGVVSQYSDYGRPRVWVRGRSYVAIAPAAVKTAAKVYSKAATEAETVLLRATGHAAEHYARIARAVGSNKVLLRA